MSGLSHQHGGNAALDFKRFGINPREFIDFSVNVHPLGVPPVVRTEWQNALNYVSHYPSQSGQGVKQFYQKRFAIEPDCVLSGNGSIELIYLIPRALKITQAIVFEPAFFDYANACQMGGLTIKRERLGEQTNFNYRFAELDLTDSKPSLIFIGRPNNPTATLPTADEILELADSYRQHVFAIDEAFLQFTERYADTLISNEHLRDNVIVLHSLTKFYSLAGLRAGALISSPAMIAKLSAFQSPWAVNGICDFLMPLIADDKTYEQAVRTETQMAKSALLTQLQTLLSFKVYGSTANFLFIKWLVEAEMETLIAGLLRQGIYVRNCTNYQGLSGNFLRTAIRSAADNQRLLTALANIG